MKLNYQNASIYNFLIENKKLKLSRLFLKLFENDIKVNKKELKELFRIVGKRELEELELKLLNILDRCKIDTIEKSTVRVKKYRDNIRAKGYKNLSIQIPPGEYEKLRKMKIKNNMNYTDLIIFLINNQKTS